MLKMFKKIFFVIETFKVLRHVCSVVKTFSHAALQFSVIAVNNVFFDTFS